ncbi:MAG: DUF3488 domain-containing transglutaminase family protein [bacterium]|nr:DUF3488 domain-containing transglutaminase family protein [bacterium]
MKFIKLKIKKLTPVVPPLTLSRGALGWLIFSLLLAISWHIPHTPIWALAVVPVLVTWRYRLFVRKKPLPSRTIRVALTLAVFGGVLLSYNSFMGRDPGITAVILLSTLKLFELKSQRDFMFVTFLCYFLVFGNFLYDQTIQGLAFMVLAVVLITASVLRLNHGENEPVKVKFLVKSGFRFLLYSIPFMLVLFTFFPRTTVPLWNLPQDSGKSGRMGFSDTVKPGQFADLAASDKPAFRVTFPDDNMPAVRDLYFRGLVLWFTNGKGWYQGILRARSGRRFAEDDDVVIRHEITLEPHFDRWLFALDIPVVIPRGARVLPGRIFQAHWPIRRLARYTVESALSPQSPETLTQVSKRWALQLPQDWDSRMRQLAQSWRESAESDGEVVQAALDYFRTSGFVYTLAPGVMDEDEPLEDFLFNKRRGFCEHYAATFTILMRAAGVPARMVIGYHGGGFNTAGDFLVVRQSDAHAWAEVWLGEKWQRVDPTGAVSPGRIRYGAEMSRRLAAMGTLRDQNSDEAFQRAMEKGLFEKVYLFLKDHWENINLKWEVWIMTYDRFRQRDFLRNIGLADVSRWSLIIVLAILIPAIFFLISLLVRRRAISSDPLVKLYQRFYRKTGKRGIKPALWEGPLDFQLRVVDAFPHQTREILEITSLYIELRYGRMPVTKESLKQLKHRVRKFKIVR